MHLAIDIFGCFGYISPMADHSSLALDMLAAGKILRPRDFRRSGIPNVVIKRLLERSMIQRVVSLGDDLLLGYALAGNPAGPEEIEHNRLAEIAVQHPSGVLCLQSALRYHGYTDEFQVPFHVAIRSGANHHTSIQNLSFVRWSDSKRFEIGVDRVSLGGVSCSITDPARTVADLYGPGRNMGADRMRAMSMLAGEHGEEAVRKALSHAVALGWGKAMEEAVQGFLEGWRCNRGRPRP